MAPLITGHPTRNVLSKHGYQPLHCSIGALLSLVLLSVLSIFPAYGAEEEMEEIVVTGSLIKRDNFDLASPVQVIDQFEIEAALTTALGEILYNVPANLGMLVTANPQESSNAYTQGTQTFANLRGLGPSATMEMMDGRRLIYGDANNNYPQIALNRIEILMDGASALYGSEAIAGVVNYVPYKKFDGMRLVFDQRVVLDASDAQETRFAFIGGSSNATTNMVAALEVRKADPISQTDFPKRIRGPYELNRLRSPYYYNGTIAGTNPGTFAVPRRSSYSGNRARVSYARDPGCGHGFNDGGDDPTVLGALKNGYPSASGLSCIGYRGEIATYRADLEQMNGYVRFDHQLRDDLTIEFEATYGRQESSTPTTTTPTVFSDFPTAPYTFYNMDFDDPRWAYVVPSELPGNPFRAHTDPGVYGGIYSDSIVDETDTLLYARDLNGDGYPDRDIDLDGDPATYTADEAAMAFMDPRYPIILADDRDDPNSGVPFAEDVGLMGLWAPYLKGLQGQPAQVDRLGRAERRDVEENWRYTVGGIYQVMETDWEVRAHYTWGVRIQNRKNALGSGPVIKSSVVDAIRCQAGPDRDICFNPFSSAQFKFVDGVPQDVVQDEDLDGTGPGNNALELHSIFSDEYSENINEMTLLDVVAAGSLPITLPGGRIGLAVGMHYRLEEEEHVPDAANSNDDRLFGTGYKKRETEQEANDYFAELILPLMASDTFGNLELQLAVRDTTTDSTAIVPRTSGSGSYSTSLVKYAALYQFQDWLSLRASYGEGFVIPDQFTAFGDVRTGSSGADYTCDILEDAAGDPLLLDVCETVGFSTTTLPSPDLEAETSEMTNFGFTLKFLEGDLTLQADFAKVEFVNQVNTLGTGDQGDLLEPGFRTALDSAGCPPTADPAVAEACWRATRLTYTSTVEAAAVTNRTGFTRDAAGNLTHALISATNSSSEIVETMDVTLNYTLPWDRFGLWRFRVNGTHVGEWKGQLLEVDPFISCAGTGGAGCPTGAPPTPDWRINASITWSRQNQIARITGRYHASVKEVNVSTGVCVDERDNPFCEIESGTYVDGFYQYRWQGLFGGERDTVLSIGIQNMFDHQPPVIGQGGGVDNYLDSPLGRIVTFRINQSL